MLSWSYKVGFLGTILLWEICLNRTGAGVNATPALNRQGGNVRVAASYAVEFFFQNEYVSYAGRSGRASVRSRRSAGRGFFQLQKQPCQKIWTLRALVFGQDCFFRVSLPKCQSSYSPPAADKLISSTHPFTEKLRSDSFQKLRMTKIEEPLKKMHRIF